MVVAVGNRFEAPAEVPCPVLGCWQDGRTMGLVRQHVAGMVHSPLEVPWIADVVGRMDLETLRACQVVG